MRELHKRLLKQTAEMAEQGAFGDSIKMAREEYRELPPGIAVLLKTVIDAYSDGRALGEEILRMRDLFTQLIVVAYRDAARIDQQVALALAHSFIEDYPGVKLSCIAPQFCALLQAALAFREVGSSTSSTLVWQQMSRMVHTYNEFLCGLMGFMIPCLRIARGQPADTRVFSMPYSARIEQMNSLTGGEDGAFYLISRLAKPRIRNAIAHGSAWVDSHTAKVYYTDGGREKQEYELDLQEFALLAMTGSHLVQPYLAAIGTIAVMEDGSDLAKALLPKHLQGLFLFRGKT
ncbi:hypothetical protein ThidrDRAFT_3195 [Thiorhodococcus drewsii AZ1]|uniref:Uncharacterized protein n=1 Tax=Thiorhodococcus drewsii AZ1 TaxID=765913 RepID=G2E4I2_9GAMM|nr:hypothetical protein [Thiorhodococcus drewsii]EGV29603.1 hypothetical protein ThidrDRAFT_3195 [Thiorhodococcus drewsii AZ1]